jgi:hypothetical protein
MNERIRSKYILIGSLIGFLFGVALGYWHGMLHLVLLGNLILIADVFAKLWIVILVILAVPLVVTNLFVSFVTVIHEKLAVKIVINGLFVHVGLLISCTLLSVGLSYVFTQSLNLDLSISTHIFRKLHIKPVFKAYTYYSQAFNRMWHN